MAVLKSETKNLQLISDLEVAATEWTRGKGLIGRAPHCDVKITSHGVSKEHAEIHVYKDKIMVADLKSSNGTYVNGVRVQNGLIRLGDKMSVHDVIFDIIPAPDIRPTPTTVPA